MGEWDDLKKQFSERSSEIKNSGQRASEKLRLVEAQQQGLWASLNNAAEAAVKDVNGSNANQELLFVPNDIKQPPSFRIEYPAGKIRAEAKFTPTTHSVHTGVFRGGGGEWQHRDYTIRADDDNRAYFFHVSGQVTVSEIVRFLLACLLEGSRS